MKPKDPHGAGPAGLRAELVIRLVQERGLDQPGALAVVDADPKLRGLLGRWAAADPEELAERARRRVDELCRLAGCLRCGTCCRVSSPTLYQPDGELLGQGRLERDALYSLRAGEMVYSARLGRAAPLERDLVKLREAPGGGCVFLRGAACGNYQARPLQCRHLECWSGRNAGDLEDLARLDRRDLFQDDATALALIEEFDLKVPAAKLTDRLGRAARGEAAAAEQALELVELDHRLRAAITRRYGYGVPELEIMLGRSALAVAESHGLEVVLAPDQRPRLRPKASPGGAI